MSTTAIGPETPAARLITSSGKVHKADPFGGVDHPPWQPALAAPMVGGGLGGRAGGVGVAVGVVEVVATGLGIVGVEGASARPKQDVVAATGIARQHRKTTSLRK